MRYAAPIGSIPPRERGNAAGVIPASGTNSRLESALRKREKARRAWLVAQKVWLAANAEIEKLPVETSHD